MAKCDMHVHSSFSKERMIEFGNKKHYEWYEKIIMLTHSVLTFGKRKKHWALYFKSGYTPKKLYDLAISRGMDFFCLTDHDTIDGWKSFIKEYPELTSKLITGVEVTTRIPGKDFDIHVNIYGLGEKEFNEIEKLKSDVKNVVEYCRRKDIICSINHIVNSPFHKIATALRNDECNDSDCLLKMFDYAEARNRHDSRKTNKIAENLVKRNRKIMLAGTDSHVGDIGKTWTEVKNAKTAREFLEGIKKGKAKIGGEFGNSKVLEHEVIEQSRSYDALYYTDDMKNFDKKLKKEEYWKRNFVYGITFSIVEKLFKVFIKLAARRGVKWLEKKGV